MIRFLFVFLCFLTSCIKNNKPVNYGDYVAEYYGEVEIISLNANGEFYFNSTTQEYLSEDVGGIWNFDGDSLILNSTVNKNTPNIVCVETKNVECRDSISIFLHYVDLSEVKGELILMSDNELKD